MVGRPPALVNSHQHTALFGPVGDILLRVLAHWKATPYLRRVCEPWSMLRRIPGARVKRAVLTFLGRRHARMQDAAGLPGNDWLAGITDPPWVADPEFFVRWLSRVPGRRVELACHPGYWDETLIGRDCGLDDGLLQRRVDELHLLRRPIVLETCCRAGFTLVAPSQLAARVRGLPHAA
jgi:hypothetical protein